MPQPRHQRKPLRLGPALQRAALEPGFFSSQVHVVFGGTGAVGGATVLALVSMLEEQADYVRRFHRDSVLREDAPAGRIVVTGRSHAEIRSFTTLLFQIQQRDHDSLPTKLDGGGYRTVGGVVIELETFGIDPSIPELTGFAAKSSADQAAAIEAFSTAAEIAADAADDAKARALMQAVSERVGRPFSEFVRGVTERIDGDGRVQSVVVGIPMASVATYKLADIEQAGERLGVRFGSPEMKALKDAYLTAMVDDLGSVQSDLAREVLIAHTTAVGGMYDIEPDGSRTIRLGFAHSAKGELLRGKQDGAIKLTELYAARRIKMLITAAAIGIDAILAAEKLPLNARIKAMHDRARADGREVVPADEQGSVRVYEPLDLAWRGETSDAVRFERGELLVPRFAIRSGENGYFSISNADALYRVMLVTSSSELGLVLARVGLLGDDPHAPFFEDSVCYYDATDNSRQVFDLLSDPPLLAEQISGLEPKALQDLGSSKHQGEMHTLGLLILLHRLRTLDVDRVPREPVLTATEAKTFFESHSKALTIERAASWEPVELARQLAVLVSANEDHDLYELLDVAPMESDLAGLEPILNEVLRAIRAIVSLGSPILYVDSDGRERVLAGPYLSPLDGLLTTRDAIERAIRAEAAGVGSKSPAELELATEFCVANYGFVDLRPKAVLVTARALDADVASCVRTFDDPAELASAAAEIEPYSYFSTSGLIALRARLEEIAQLDRSFDLRLGTANEFRAHIRRDDSGRALLVPGVVEALRMKRRGQEKATGTERLG